MNWQDYVSGLFQAPVYSYMSTFDSVSIGLRLSAELICLLFSFPPFYTYKNTATVVETNALIYAARYFKEPIVNIDLRPTNASGVR